MLIHVLSIFTEEYVLNHTIFIKWVNKTAVLLDFSLTDYFNQLVLIEVLIGVLHECNL